MIAFTYLAYLLLLLTMISPLFHLFMALTKNKKENGIQKQKEQSMTILIPCYNEQSILQTTLEGLQNIDYGNHDIIFINDDSKDDTLLALKKMLDLQDALIRKNKRIDNAIVRGYYQSKKYPNISVIDKENGGKADSLNAALAFSDAQIVITLDADTVLQRNALHVVNNNFEKNVIAAGGYVRVLQGANVSGKHKFSFKLKHIVRFQTLEYAKGFGILKKSLSKVNAMMVISGAFGIFDRAILTEIGGYRKTIGEDIDITLKFQEYISRHPKEQYKMTFIPEAVCYTECPENWKDLYKQRIRWQKAFVDCIIRYKAMFTKTMFTNPLSFFVVFDSFLVGTVASYVSLGSMLYIIINPFDQIPKFAIFLLLYSTFISVIWNVVAFASNRKMNVHYNKRDIPRMAGTIILDLVFFRFLGMIYIVLGTIMYFFNKHDWNKVARTGTVYSLPSNQDISR